MLDHQRGLRAASTHLIDEDSKQRDQRNVKESLYLRSDEGDHFNIMETPHLRYLVTHQCVPSYM